MTHHMMWRNLDASLSTVSSVMFCLTAIVCSFAMTSTMCGSEPPPPPSIVNVFSRGNTILATSYPATNETIIYSTRDNNTPQEVLWTFPKYFRRFDVSIDGYVIVAQNADLLPKDVDDNCVLLTFINRGKVAREVTLKQLLGSKSKLRATVGDLSWGVGLYFPGIDQNGYVFVDTVIGFFIFDAYTAKCIFPPNNSVN
jgi:hypothetical protein